MEFMAFKINRWAALWMAGLLLCATVLLAQTPKPQPPSPTAPAAQAPAPIPMLQSATKTNEAPLFPKDMVILTVGDHQFTVEDYNRLMEVVSPQQRAFFMGTGRRQFANDYSQLVILSDEARKQKLTDDPTVKTRLQLMADQSLAQVMIQRIQDGIKIPDEETQKYYNDHLKEYDQVKASHILISFKGSAAPTPPGKKELTEAEAKEKADEIYKEVTKPGADFAAIAKAESYDTGSAARGGDLGLFRHGQMIAPFEEAAFALKPGEISQPVKSPFGYHIIKVEEKKSQTLEQAKSEIETTLRRQKVEQALNALKASTKVVMNDQFFPLPPAAAPAAKPAPTTPPPPSKKPE